MKNSFNKFLTLIFDFFLNHLIIFLSGIFFLTTKNALAFPDTLRHGYTNCTTCHLSPSGGGLLTAYGRSLSRELISTWGFENEEQPLHGLIKIPESQQDTIFIGGDLRSLSLNESKEEITGDETEIENESEYFLMQTQLRMGLGIEKLKLIGSLGKIEDPKKEKKIRWVSTEYYALWAPKEEVFARLGRFEPIFGLRMPDHNLWIKSEFDLVPWAERDTVEFIYEGESQFLSVSGFQSTSQSPTSHTTGYVVTANQILGERNRIGFSGMNQEGQGLLSRAISLHGTFSMNEKLYLLTENTQKSFLGKTKNIHFFRLGYDFIKGLTATLQVQVLRDFNSSDSNKTKNGVGFMWYPRPHFEIVTNFEIEKSKTETEKISTLLFHYYL